MKALVRASLLALALGTVHFDALAEPAPPMALVQQHLSLEQGSRVVVPGTWRVQRSAGMLVLEMPEGGARMAVVEVAAADAAQAIGAAWARFSPGFDQPLPKLIDLPAARGWTQRVVASYEGAGNADHLAEAQLQRAGALWAVLLSDGKPALFDKRQADVAIISASLAAPGFAPESLAGRAPHRLDAARIDRMQAFAVDAMARLHLPGLALALLDHGEIVYETGLGVRQLGGTQAVDTHTLFMNASTTKAMTTMMMARLVDQGKLRWDTPATALYPGFRLGDAARTSQVQVHHLVCACTGLPRRDIELLFNFRHVSPETLIARIGATAPTSEFGEVYQYNNQLAAAAGYLAGHAAYPGLPLGQAYDKAMRELLFAPLGMHDTTFDMRVAQARNHAEPHGFDLAGAPAPAAMDLNYSGVPIRPAGGAWTSVHDLARFVQFEARAGVLADGRRLISADNVLERRQPQVITGLDTSYGMGLGINGKLGITSINHSGSLFGFNSTIFLVPDSGIGLVAMSNGEQGMGMLNLLTRRLLELAYDARPEAEATLDKLVQQVEANAADKHSQVAGADHALDAQLAPRYANAALGTLKVTQAGAYRLFDFGDWKTRVVARKDDSGAVYFGGIDPTADFVEFRAGVADGRRTLVVEIGQEHFQFDEVGAAP